MNSISKTIIITSYIETPFPLDEHVYPQDTIICTDGGYDIALNYNLKPDIIMGDFDSITSDLPDDIPVIRFNPVKDYTDLQLALDKAIELESDKVEIWGAIGGRFDQTVASIQLLNRYYNEFKTLRIKDGANEAFILTPNETHSIPALSDYYLSLFSLSEKCENVTVKGTKYQLENHTLQSNFPLGVSNEFQSKSATISFESGTLLVVLSKM